MSEKTPRHHWEGPWAFLKHLPISNKRRAGRNKASRESGGHDIRNLRGKWRPGPYDVNDPRNREGTSADTNGDQ